MRLAKSRGKSPPAACASMSAPCLMRQLTLCRCAPEAARWSGVAPEPKQIMQVYDLCLSYCIWVCTAVSGMVYKKFSLR